MPSCAIISCRRRSQTTNVPKDNISFHRFPFDPNIKEKWIDATGRIGWFPTKFSTICSSHFKDADYIIKGKRNYLNLHAVPTVHISQVVTDLQTKTSGQELPSTSQQQDRAGTRQASLLHSDDDCDFDQVPGNAESPGEDADDDLSMYINIPKKSAASAGQSLSEGNDDNHHVGFTCNSCSGEIRGYRYTCVQCLDYDLCATCEMRGAHCLHYVLRIPTPKPAVEIQSVLNKIRTQLLYGMDGRSDAQPLATAEEELIKAEIKEEVPDPLSDGDDGMESVASYSTTDDIPQTATKETIKPLQILNVNTATTTETIHGNTLVIIENPVSTGSVASSSTPIAGNTKRKHESPIKVSIEKQIKLEPQERQVPNIRTNTYIDVPITGYVPVPTVSGTIGTSCVSGGKPEKDSAEKDVAGESSFQVFSHTKKKPQDEPRQFSGKASTASKTKKKCDSTNK